ncbi:MAG: hypothetical protein K0S41_1345 [Anaerocolumna sp.]|jgi:hypothetical protein|nr:hypothetical protein [Anaerocolumna sp.]
MKKLKKRIICLIILLLTLFTTVPVYAEPSFYTYTYDFWGDERESPDAYVPSTVLMGNDFGIGSFKEPQGLFVRDKNVYICDSFNNRIVELIKNDTNYSLVRVIDKIVMNGEESTLAYPQDIFVTETGDLYICDTNNQRILILNNDLDVIKIITKPEDETIDSTSDFLPIKLVVDSAGRIYVQAMNVNKGLMEFAPEGTFTGYIGANKVTVNLVDYFWKMISTKAQRAQMELFVPTEYNNLALDLDGFIYTTTSTFNGRDLISGGANPIRKLNSMGTDILVRNGFYPPIGDIYWGNAGGISGSSKLIDVVALENDTYCAVDRVRGRIFSYDFQGNLLYAFGGQGNKAGFFQYPSAIEDIGDQLLVLDSRSATLTELSLTQYGRLINEGLMQYKKGNYDLSAKKWEEVLKFNGNYDLAYIGIGRSFLRKGEYKKAMEYFELKMDDENYSKAFKLYRKELVEDNIGYALIVLAAFILIPKVIKIFKKIKREVEKE